MTEAQKLDFIKQLGVTPISTRRPRTPGKIKKELTNVIERGSVNNIIFSEDMKLGIFYALLWQFGYDYDEAMSLAKELLK